MDGGATRTPAEAPRVRLKNNICALEQCNHESPQYVIKVELAQLNGAREGTSCRKHVALVAKALAEDLRAAALDAVELSELEGEAE